MEKQDLVVNGAIDVPDERDYKHEDVFEEGGSLEELPSRLLHTFSSFLNQGRTMECTIFSATRGMNETNGLEQNAIGVPYKETVSVEKLKPLCYKYGFSDATGGPIIGPLDALRKDLAMLTGRTTVARSVNDLKRAIQRGVVCTGSNKIGWSGLEASSFVVTKETPGSPGHAFPIFGWDDAFETPLGKGVFICPNSYGVEWGRDGGYFYIPYELVMSVTYSLYFLVDASNASPLYRYKAKLAGIWNGEREGDNLTRYEASLMAQRVRKAFTGSIWNEQNGDSPVIRQDFITMVERVVGKNVEWSGERPMDNITRGEAAEICGKLL